MDHQPPPARPSLATELLLQVLDFVKHDLSRSELRNLALTNSTMLEILAPKLYEVMKFTLFNAKKHAMTDLKRFFGSGRAKHVRLVFAQWFAMYMILRWLTLRRFVLVENLKDVSKITEMFMKAPGNQFVAAMSVWDSKFQLYLFLDQDKQEDLRWLPGLLATFEKHCAGVCMNVVDHLAIEVEGIDMESHAERLPLRNEAYVPPAKPKPLRKISENAESVPPIEKDDGKNGGSIGKGENDGSSGEAVIPTASSSVELDATSGEGEHVEAVATNMTSSESTVLMPSRSELSAIAYLETTARGINDTTSTESITFVPPDLTADRGFISNTTSIDSMSPPPLSESHTRRWLITD